MWTYRQSTGEFARDGTPATIGYSGAGAGKNDPALQNVRDVGPIPQGRYKIDLALECTVPLDGAAACAYCGGRAAHRHGPFVLRLTPDPANEMFGRSGFLIHGDSVAHPGMASEGCIILDRATRLQIVESGDGDLTVAR